MRVVLVSPMPPRRDGLADYSAGVRDAYLGAGHAVAVVRDVPDPDAPRERQALGALALRPLPLLRTVRKVWAYRADVVHVQHTIATYGIGLAALWLVVLVARARGSFVLVTHHEVTRDVARLGAVGRAYYRLTACAAHRLHVHTPGAADVLVRDLGVPAAKVVRSPHPVFDLPASSVGPDDLRARHRIGSRTLVLQFGFVQVEKGLHELVEAVAALLARAPRLREELRVVVAGDVRHRAAGFARFEQDDHDYLERVQRAVAGHGLGDVVLFTGGVPSEEVGAWFRAADLVTLPYTNAEQSGVANLAIAADAPVLSSRISGLGDLFSTLPSLDDLTPTPFANALERAIADPSATRAACAPVYRELRRAASPTAVVDLAMRDEHGGRA